MLSSGTSFFKPDESSAIKGVLIFLIILGHNMLFTLPTESIQFMGYIYCFHIQAFFILPFLYNIKPMTRKRGSDLFFRLLWPYLFLSLLLSVGYYNIYLGNHFNFLEVLTMWLTGSPALLKAYCGVQIFWFLPAMFVLSLVKDYYYHSNNYVRGLILILSIAANILLYHPLLYSIPTRFLPFSLLSGVSYVIYGVIARLIVDRIYKNTSNLLGACAITLFAILSALYFINSLHINLQAIRIALPVIMPVLFILILWIYRGKLERISPLKHGGEKSFPIYLIHPFIGYLLFWIVQKYSHISIDWGCIAQIIMVFGSYYLAGLLYKNRRLLHFLLPRNAKELISTYRPS